MSEQTPNPPWGGAQPPQPGSPAPQSWGPPASAAYGGFGAQSAEPTWGQGTQQQQWQTPDGAWQGGAPAAAGGLGLSGRHLGLAALIGVAAYLVAAVASSIVMLLQSAALGSKVGGGNFFASIPTWISGSFGNTRTLAYTQGDKTQALSWGSTGMFVVTVTLLSVLLLGRLLLRKVPVGKGAPRLILAGVTSIVFFALMLVLALTVHWGISQGEGRISLKAVSALGIIIALISVGFVAYLAYSPRGDSLLPSITRKAGSQFVEHVLIVGGVYSLVYFFVYSASAGKRGWLSFLEIIPGWGVTTMNIFGSAGGGPAGGGGIDATAFMGILNGFNLSTFGAFGSGDSWLSVFGTGSWWLILVSMLMLVIGLLWASLRWRLRAGQQSSPRSWFTLPAVYLVGALVIFLTSISVGSVANFSAKSFEEGVRTVVGMVSPWSIALIAALGFVVEGLSRYLAPAILRSAGGLRRFFGLGLDADWSSLQGQRTAPAGWGAPQAGQPGSGQPAAAQGAWGGQPQGGQSAAQPGQPGQSGQPAWGGGAQAAQPAQPAQPAWGGAPATQPAQPSAPAQPGQPAWGGAPATQPAAPAQPQQPAWGAPAQPEAPAQPAWGSPAPQQNAPAAPEQPAQPSWGAPPAQQAAPTPGAQPPQPAQPAWGAPPEPPAATPAWGGQNATGQQGQWGQPAPDAQPAEDEQQPPAWGRPPQPGEPGQQPPQTGWRP